MLYIPTPVGGLSRVIDYSRRIYWEGGEEGRERGLQGGKPFNFSLSSPAAGAVCQFGSKKLCVLGTSLLPVVSGGGGVELSSVDYALTHGAPPGEVKGAEEPVLDGQVLVFGQEIFFDAG